MSSIVSQILSGLKSTLGGWHNLLFHVAFNMNFNDLYALLNCDSFHFYQFRSFLLLYVEKYSFKCDIYQKSELFKITPAIGNPFII